jgi:hypothetical protein
LLLVYTILRFVTNRRRKISYEIPQAILLPDGRVLISGSDPQSIFNPEEFRIEVWTTQKPISLFTDVRQVYIPPYLAQGRIQPSFNISQTDWAYGSQHNITVTLHQGTTSTMKVSLISGRFRFADDESLTVA